MCQQNPLLFRAARRSDRAALTILEFVGCVVAIAAGIWIGAIYTGVDLPQAAGVICQRVGLPVPEALAPKVDELADDQQLVAATANSEDGATATEEGAPSGGTSLEDTIRRAAANQPAAGRTQVVGQATLQYWNRLNEVMAEEEAMRQVPAEGLTAGNAVAFLVQRQESSTFAAESIAAIPTQHVDGQVIDLAESIANWYRKGVSQAELGIQLMGSDPASRKGSPGKQWQTAEQQHLQEVQLINRRGDALRATLIGTYGLDFPDLR